MALEAAARKQPRKERTPRGDWAERLGKTFDFAVFACVRGGGRGRVLREGDAVRRLDVNPDAPRPLQPKLP